MELWSEHWLRRALENQGVELIVEIEEPLGDVSPV
jgi:hypothetical protein